MNMVNTDQEQRNLLETHSIRNFVDQIVAAAKHRHEFRFEEAGRAHEAMHFRAAIFAGRRQFRRRVAHCDELYFAIVSHSRTL